MPVRTAAPAGSPLQGKGDSRDQGRVGRDRMGTAVDERQNVRSRQADVGNLLNGARGLQSPGQSVSELSDLYQEVILDHNRRPRNWGSLPDATRSAEGYNPLCGDRLKLHL